MTADLEKLEAIQKQAYFESKAPASIKDTYTAITGKDELVSRELIVDGRIVLGIKYAPDGTPVSAYTTDKTGKHISLEQVPNNNQSQNHATKDLISACLEKVSKNFTPKQKPDHAEQKTDHAEQKPTPQKTVRKIETNNLNLIKNNTRQNG